jgi:hypothetical protein
MLQVGCSLSHIIIYAQDYDGMQSHISDVYGSDVHPQVLLALYILALVLSSPVLFLLTNLIGLHIYLNCKGITTYNYIKSKRKARSVANALTDSEKPTSAVIVEATAFDVSRSRTLELMTLQEQKELQSLESQVDSHRS